MQTARIPEPAPAELRPSRFSHLVVKTAQLPAMVAFYEAVLLAKPMFENAQVCFLTYDDEHHRIMIGNAPDARPRDPAAVGVVHWAYSFETFEQLVNAYVRLRDEGILPASCVNHGFTTSLYYADPDGNEVETMMDNFSAQDTQDYKRYYQFSEEFGEMSEGNFDPDKMVALYESGTPDKVLLDREEVRRMVREGTL